MQNNLLPYVHSVARKYILTHKPHVLLFLTASFITAFTTILLPYLLGYYTDDVVLNKNINHLYTSITIIIVSIVFGQISSVISGVYSTRIHGNAYIAYNLDILAHVQDLPLSFFHDKDSAYITKRINDDTEEVISFLLDNFVNLIIDIAITLSIVTILLVKFHVMLTLIFMSAIALDILLYYYFRNIIYKISYAKKEMQNDYFASLNESVSKIKFIKSQAINDLVRAHLASKFQILLQTFIKFTKANHSYVSLSKFIRRISIVFVLIICGNGIFSGDITAGDFVLSVTYFMLGFSCLDSFPELAKKWQNVSVSIDRIKTILKQEVDYNGEAKTDSIHSISLINVNHLSNNDNNIVLNKTTFTFTKGFVYAITGNNGAGKSTLLNMIIGLLPTDSGEILYNNYSAKDFNTTELRAKHFSYCDQTDDFLNMSIRQNVILNNTNFDPKHLNTLLEQFDLKGKLENETISNESACDIKLLSGGEKRKISLTRTLLKDSSVYIFDEPTNALDAQGIRAFKDIIASMKPNKIIIIVTHDKSLAEIADYVLKL